MVRLPILLVLALVVVASAWSVSVRAAEPGVVPLPAPAAVPLPVPADAPPLPPTLTTDTPPPEVRSGAAPGLIAAPPPAPAPARVPIARRWWFWTALGGAAVGVIVAGIVLSPHQPYQGNAQPGLVPIFGN